MSKVASARPLAVLKLLGKRVLRGKRIHIAAEQVMQKSLCFFARNFEHAELRQVAQHSAVARGGALGGGIAEMLHGAVLYLRALRSQEILPILIHRYCLLCECVQSYREALRFG